MFIHTNCAFTRANVCVCVYLCVLHAHFKPYSVHTTLYGVYLNSHFIGEIYSLALNENSTYRIIRNVKSTIFYQLIWNVSTSNKLLAKCCTASVWRNSKKNITEFEILFYTYETICGYSPEYHSILIDR